METSELKWVNPKKNLNQGWFWILYSVTFIPKLVDETQVIDLIAYSNKIVWSLNKNSRNHKVAY